MFFSFVYVSTRCTTEEFHGWRFVVFKYLGKFSILSIRKLQSRSSNLTFVIREGDSSAVSFLQVEVSWWSKCIKLCNVIVISCCKFHRQSNKHFSYLFREGPWRAFISKSFHLKKCKDFLSEYEYLH